MQRSESFGHQDIYGVVAQLGRGGFATVSYMLTDRFGLRCSLCAFGYALEFVGHRAQGKRSAR